MAQQTSRAVAALRAAAAAADGGDGDADADADDVLTQRDLPPLVVCHPLQFFDKTKKGWADVRPMLVETYFYIAASRIPPKLTPRIFDAYKKGPFSTEESRAILVGTIAKATFSNSSGRDLARTRDAMREPGGRIPGWEVAATLFHKCPWIIEWRFEHEEWANPPPINELDRGDLGLAAVARRWGVSAPRLGDRFVSDGDDAVEDDDASEAPDSMGVNPAEQASYGVIDGGSQPTDGSQPAGVTPARPAPTAAMVGTTRSSPRRQPLGAAPESTPDQPVLPNQSVRLERNPTGTAHWGFVCEEAQLAQHLDALATRIAADALGCAEKEVKIPADVREKVCDTLRTLLRPPPNGRLWDEHVSGDEPYMLACRPNHYTTTEVAALVRARQAGAVARATAGAAQPASWTWQSMARLIELWTMQAGASLAQWKQDDSHGISHARLDEVAKGWELILGGSTARADLDSGMLKASNKWAAITAVFADRVRRTVPRALCPPPPRDRARPTRMREPHAHSRPRPIPITARYRSLSRALRSHGALCSQACKISIRDRYAGLFTGGSVDLPAHPVGDSALSSHFATFRSIYTRFNSCARRARAAHLPSTRCVIRPSGLLAVPSSPCLPVRLHPDPLLTPPPPLRPASSPVLFSRSTYHDSGRNDSDEESHALAEKVIKMVMEAKAAKDAAPDNGFPGAVANPFDDPNVARDPRKFLYGTHEDMIPVVLYAWALSAEFDNLRSRLAKFVNEDDSLAGEAGLDEDGYAIIQQPSAALRNKTEDRSRKRKSDDASSNLAEAITSSGANLASALRAAVAPPRAAQTEVDEISSALCTARDGQARLIALRRSLMDELKGMWTAEAKEIFSDDDRRARREEYDAVNTQVTVAAAEVSRLELARELALQAQRRAGGATATSE